MCYTILSMFESGGGTMNLPSAFEEKMQGLLGEEMGAMKNRDIMVCV